MAITKATDCGGYEYTFIEPPPHRYICNICHHPSREPCMTGECCQGQTICKSCLDQWQMKNSKATACPVCGKKGDFTAYPNYHIKREIKSLNIYCTNKEKGCEWQGELSDISNHLGNSDGCQFEEVECSNVCGKIIERQFLTSHVETECPHREVNCQYCHDTGEHQFIEGQHKEECPKFSLLCPNKCRVNNILRKDMEAHRKECPLEMIHCEYHKVGCKRKLPRKYLEEHKKQKMEEHLMMTTSELTDTKAQLSAALGSLMMLMNARFSRSTITADLWPVHLDTAATMFKLGNQVCPVTIKMEEYNDKRDSKIPWLSVPFYTHNKGYKMYLRVDAAHVVEGTHLSVFLYLMKGSHDDELTWPLRGKFEIKLLNQISDSEHYSINLTYDDDVPDQMSRSKVTTVSRATCGWGYSRFISNEAITKTTPTCQYLKGDCLFFQLSFRT